MLYKILHAISEVVSVSQVVSWIIKFRFVTDVKYGIVNQAPYNVLRNRGAIAEIAKYLKIALF